MGQNETRDAWFRAGTWLSRRDNARGANEGLTRREIKALEEENTRPWGRSMFASASVSRRAEAAKKAAADKKAAAKKAAAKKARGR
jgi:hypothetical protein